MMLYEVCSTSSVQIVFTIWTAVHDKSETTYRQCGLLSRGKQLVLVLFYRESKSPFKVMSIKCMYKVYMCNRKLVLQINCYQGNLIVFTPLYSTKLRQNALFPVVLRSLSNPSGHPLRNVLVMVKRK